MLDILSSVFHTATRQNDATGARGKQVSEHTLRLAEHENRKREELRHQKLQNQRFLRHWRN